MKIAARTPITIPAMAPPDNPELLLDDADVIVTLAPVATGVWNGSVVPGVTVELAVVLGLAVMTINVDEVGRKGTPAEFVVAYIVL